MEQDKKICTVSTTQHFYFKLTAPNGIAIVSSRWSLQNVLVVLEMFQITCTFTCRFEFMLGVITKIPQKLLKGTL